MKPVHVHIQNIEELLFQLEDVIKNSKNSFLSSNKSINEDELYEIIDDIYTVTKDMLQDLPSEITRAQQLVNDREKVIEEAQNKAKTILSRAEEEREKLVADHEIMLAAEESSRLMMEDSRQMASDMRHNALEYADELLLKTEMAVRKTMEDFAQNTRETDAFFIDIVELLYDNRQELRPKE